MSQNQKSDWLPWRRAEMLSLAQSWCVLMAANQTRWNIPAGVIGELTAATMAAKTALETAQNEATRTPVATAACKTAFDALEAVLRSIKRRHVFSPPMTDADMVSLELKPYDTNPTPAAVPTAQLTVEPFLAGWHEIGIRLVYLFGGREPGAKFGFRVYYKVVGHGEAAPTDPSELHESLFTGRSKDVLKFAFADSGKTVWIAVQAENNGLKGPWGPLVSVVIP